MTTLKAHTFISRRDAEGHYLALVDSEAAKARHVDPAQETIYQRKLIEAVNGYGPLIEAEASATGVEVTTVAAAVIQQREVWEQHAHAIEVKRIKAKADIRNAATPAEMHRIVAAFKEQLTP
ncbi:hypothetical protein ACT3R4_18055 [Halomonas sp. AOP7-E1-9]|uniref:hypothetical protein n=1 Tax=unclassified Halomonas TaxID=2609666 RepID=UPI004034A396